MIVSFLLSLTFWFQPEYPFTSFLKSDSLVPDHHYVFLLTSQPRNLCYPEQLISYKELAARYELDQTIHFSHSFEVQNYMIVGLDKQDLPAIRTYSNGMFYSFRNQTTEDLFADWNLKEEYSAQLPLDLLEMTLLEAHFGNYVKFIRKLAGFQKGYNPKTFWVSLLVWTFLSGSTCFLLCSYIKKHKDELLNARHTFILAIFWVAIKCILIPTSGHDFTYHHQWRLGIYNLPYIGIYDKRCFQYDYPPLFILFQGFWSYVLAFLSPQDMRLQALLNESDYFFILMRLTAIITDFLFFFIMLYLFRTLTSSNKSLKFIVKPTVLTFSLCFMDAGLLFIDNVNPQYNSFIFSIMIVSVILMYKKRVLLSAFVYCIAISTKQITFFYSFGYVAFLLFTYIIPSHPPKINFSNGFKMGALVLSCVVLFYFPFAFKILRMTFVIFGGTNWHQAFVPNVKFIAQLLRISTTTILWVIPMIWSLYRICCLVYKERNRKDFRFPVYLFLSAMAFVNFMKFIHDKHFLYMQLPLMIYSLQSDKKVFDLMIELKIFNSFVCSHTIFGFDSIFAKYPILICCLLLVKYLIPEKKNKFLFRFLIQILYDIVAIFVDAQFLLRYVIEVAIGMHLYYRLVIHLVKPPALHHISKD